MLAHSGHCFPVAVALIRTDSSGSSGTNNYLTSCHNQIPSIMGTIQRLPAVIKLARVFFGFSIISSRRSSLSVTPAPAGSRTLARADSSRLTIRMKPRLMWWQDGSPPHLAFHLCWLLLSVPSLLSCLQGCTQKTPLSSGERAPPPRSAVVT